MIPHTSIVEWKEFSGWSSERQVELDLIISRVLVEIFSDEFLQQTLRFRGGTARNKIHYPSPYRFSEDIDLVRTSKGLICPILDRLRFHLKPWLGKPKFDSKSFLVVFRFRIPSTKNPNSSFQLKIEINTVETQIYDPPTLRTFEVNNSWFSSKTDIPTYSQEEMLATKLRALLQRDKGRDLFDLYHATSVFEDLDIPHVINLFQKYNRAANQPISKAQAQERMIEKYRKFNLTTDISALLPIKEATNISKQTTSEYFWHVFENFVNLIPGEDWAETADFIDKNRLLETVAKYKVKRQTNEN